MPGPAVESGRAQDHEAAAGQLEAVGPRPDRTDPQWRRPPPVGRTRVPEDAAAGEAPLLEPHEIGLQGEDGLERPPGRVVGQPVVHVGRGHDRG